MTNATWQNGKRQITGYYSYNRNSDTFFIRLNSRDRITGQQRTLSVHGEKPEWGNWKLVKEKL